ncbi:MAG: hypothetical protein FWD19_02965, partial [Defluviitaleaceae bacterium]|nr:hypothetical protein [Defluviitaleaceae bacterium]
MKKRYINLLLAVILFSGVFAPFAGAPNVALANVPLPPDGLDPTRMLGIAFDGDLRASFGASLAPAAGRPDYRMASGSEGSVLFNWPITTPPGGPEFMDVLRFFDFYGSRHELSVRRIAGYGEGAGLMVNYDVYMPIQLNGEIRYVHVSDPIRRGAGAEMPGFQIFRPGFGFEMAHNYFVLNDGNFPVRDRFGSTQLNRVNDRLRFDPDDDDPARIFTNTIPTYPFNTNALAINGAETIPLFESEHYDWLSPSFNIGDGMGYSFQFMGRTIHFRWEGGQFYFYIEEILSHGVVNEFDLERYSAANNATFINDYVRGTATLAPAGNRRVASNEISNTHRGTIYTFTGIETEHLTAIPFAQNEHPDVNAANTNPSHLSGFYEQGTATGNAANLIAPFPAYHVGRLDMTLENNDGEPVARPARQDVGLDIRFNLPMFFNEDEGGYTDHITSRPVGNQMSITMTVAVGGAQTPEDFEVRMPIRNMPTFAGDASENNGTAAGWQATLRVDEFIEGRQETRLRDASLLHRAGTESADRVRIKVDGLSPSIAYERGLLSILPIEDAVGGPRPTNFLSAAEKPICDYDIPFYTFLEYRFDRLLGRDVIIALPYNRSVAALGRGHFTRTGYYQLVTQFPYFGFAPVRVNEASTEVYFSLPPIMMGAWEFFITMSQTFPLPPSPPNMLLSQIAWWQPRREPGIDIPNNFSVSQVRHRPMREPEAGFDRFQAGVLDYRLQWNIAPFRDIMARLGHGPVEERDRYGNADDVLRVRYVVGLSTSPETEAMIAGGDSVHREYLGVDMLIRRARDEAGNVLTNVTDRVEVMYLESSDFIPARYRGTPETPHPILNREEWISVVPRTDPSLGDNVLFASIDVHTNSVRRHRYPPPPQHMRRDFHFPGVYFMNVRLDNWGYADDLVRNLGGESPWSLFDYIVVEDIPELEAPPPAAISVEVGPEDKNDTRQPFLNVTYSIPTGAVRTYLDTQYPMDTQITTNLYVGRFEEAIMNNFFPFAPPPAQNIRRAIAPELRRPDALPLRAYSIDFNDPRLQKRYNLGRTELDLSDATIQRILRGEVRSGEPVSGVVRITGVPLIHNYPVTVSDDDVTVSFAAGGIVNFEPNEEITRAQSFAATRAIVNSPSDFGINLRLTNIDENSKFFVFADLEIEKWLENEDENGN